MRAGELHAVMGPNGSGKSTLANVLLGNPAYEVTSGTVLFRRRGHHRTGPPTSGRKAGIFLAFQYPEEIAGVPVAQFLRQAVAARRGTDLSVLEVRVHDARVDGAAGHGPGLRRPPPQRRASPAGRRSATRSSRWRCWSRTWPILDETDSGLDIDALRIVARGVHTVREARPELGVLVVTHYRRMLDELKPDASTS